MALCSLCRRGSLIYPPASGGFASDLDWSTLPIVGIIGFFRILSVIPTSLRREWTIAPCG